MLERKIDLVIGVVGDTHANIDKVMAQLVQHQPEHLFFTGDFYDDGLRIANHLNITIDAVTGNCDCSSNQETEEKIIQINSFKFLIVHGHQFGVKSNLNRLSLKAESIGADIVLFGHTHVPFLEKINNIYFMNPGSPSCPRNGSQASYGIIKCQGGKIQPYIIEMP